MPSSVTFAPGETQKTFTVRATDDNVDDDGESVRLGFGRLPSSVEGGSPSTATVLLVEDAGVSTWYVWFGESSYTATEGGTARISLHLSAPWKPDLNEALTVPLFTPEHQGGASADDYSGVPSSVTFQRGQTQASFTVRASEDSDDDDGESVLIQFRRLFPDDLEVGRAGPRGDDSADAEQPRGHGGRLFRPADERDLRGVGNGAELYPHRDGRQRRRRSGERGDRLRVAPRAGVGGQPVAGRWCN